ncbi:MAG TPA: UDP-N-acetylglucosamine 2-epimerase (non-hydrolyzing) [Trebonia sp.]|nr:UDP-N-acetylglucosamine 2-epimerase (non-hydrolyzing) [Trebonia sp.]
MNVTVGFGTRPEIVKLAPVIAALRAAGWPVRVVFTGQHHDPALGERFLADLAVAPDVCWLLPDDPRHRLGALIDHACAELAAHRPDLVLLLGDTFTVPAFCLAARAACIPLAHLEAGLRSFNETSAEEVNRRIAAVTASLHFAPTDLAAGFLRAEGVPGERVHVVGNPVIDVLAASGVRRRPPARRHGLLVTAHRASTVDHPARLAALAAAIAAVARAAGPATFPVHPRTSERLAAAGLDGPLRAAGVKLVPPQPYHAMLELVAGCRVVVTDSGGLQEEAAWLGVPVVVLRTSTPRWEGVAAGCAELVGLDAGRAVKAVRRYAGPGEQRRVAAVPCPYGSGGTARRVLDILADPVTGPLLRLTAPDFTGREPPSCRP